MVIIMERKKYRLVFNYNFLEKIDFVLENNKPTTKRFEQNQITYVIEIPLEKENQILNSLILIANKQIKIYDLNKEFDDDIPMGTDKPLGSKEAIDEN